MARQHLAAFVLVLCALMLAGGARAAADTITPEQLASRPKEEGAPPRCVAIDSPAAADPVVVTPSAFINLNAQFIATLTPSLVMRTIIHCESYQIEAWIDSLDAQQRLKLFTLLRKTLEVSTAYEEHERAKIERIALFYDDGGVFFDAFVQGNKCNDRKAVGNSKCESRQDGAAFARYSRLARVTCWKTLALAAGKPLAFRDGIRDYYTRSAGADAPELAICTAPPLPSRCKLAYCTVQRSRGVAIRPLTDLGIAVPIGTPRFGFKPDESVAVQASAGLLVRGFVSDGDLDVRLGAGITNAVGSDGMTSTVGLAWTLQVSAFEVIGVGFLGITNPRNASTGKALTFSIDLVGIRDIIGDSKGE